MPTRSATAAAADRIRTMEDFPYVSGISRPTLSRFFNDPQSVRPASRARIEDAMQRFGYRPNLLAVNFNRRNHKTLGIVVPSLMDSFHAGIVQRIEWQSLEAGYWTVIQNCQGAPEREAEAVATLLSMKVAGMIAIPLGAVFTEVSVDPLTMELTVERMVGAFACGRIIELAIARNQLVGGMTWGIEQALFEETHVDRRTGRWMNANLAEALIPTHADVRSVQAIMIKDDETHTHPISMKGVSEIGVLGPAPAIANALFDATVGRVRSLPITLERRMQATEVVGDE